MTNITAEEADKMAEEIDAQNKADQEFLLGQGWIPLSSETQEIYLERWLSPEKKEYSFNEAILVAEERFLYKNGWKIFSVRTFYPKLKKEVLDDDTTMAMFIHPHYKVYHWLEAVDIALNHNNKDTEFRGDSPRTCRKTKEIQKIINEQNIFPEEEMLLECNFLPVDGKYVHEFKSVQFANWHWTVSVSENIYMQKINGVWKTNTETVSVYLVNKDHNYCQHFSSVGKAKNVANAEPKALEAAIERTPLGAFLHKAENPYANEEHCRYSCKGTLHTTYNVGGKLVTSDEETVKDYIKRLDDSNVSQFLLRRFVVRV